MDMIPNWMRKFASTSTNYFSHTYLVTKIGIKPISLEWVTLYCMGEEN